MNIEELRKKIVEIIINAIWKDAQADYDSIDESEARTIADALIAARIGDVSSEKAMRELAEAFHREKCAEYDLLNYQMQKSEYRIAAAEHRADVAERALLNLCVDIQPYSLFDQTPLVTEASVKMQEYLQQAEKEIAEERKDD